MKSNTLRLKYNTKVNEMLSDLKLSNHLTIAEMKET